MANHKIVKVEWYAPRLDQGLVRPDDVYEQACVVTSVGFMIKNRKALTICANMRDGQYENVLTIPDCCIFSMEILSDKED